MTVTNGRMYLFGTDYNGYPIVQVFNPGTNVWSSLGTMAAAPFFSGCAPLPANANKILVVLQAGSGFNAGIFDVTTNTWTYVPDTYNDYSCGLTLMGTHLCMNSCGLYNKFDGCNEYLGGDAGTSPAWSKINTGTYILGSRYDTSTIMVDGSQIPNKPNGCTGI